MAYTTDTEVRTQIRRDNRFGGYNTTESTQRNLFEPEFRPFSYGTDQIVASTDQIVASTDQIVASTDQIVASTDQIVASEPQFTIEKQYQFNKSSYDEEETSQRQMNITDFKRATEVEQQREYKEFRRAKLNARGKIAVAVYTIVAAIILAFCVYNAVMISSLNSSIAAKNQLVSTETQVITDLTNTYNSLGEDDYIVSQVGDNYKVPTSQDMVAVSDFNLKVREEVKEETNWFEKFCESFKKLFE